MTAGRFLTRRVVVAVAMFVRGFIGRQLWLGRDHVAIEPIMRGKGDMRGPMPFALISCFAFSGAPVWIYSQFPVGDSWWGQGIRFAIAVWAVAMVPLFLTNYTVKPWPGIFVARSWRGSCWRQ